MGFEKVFLKILWLKYCTYMFPPQTYKIVKCLSEFSKTGLNKRIPREGTRTVDAQVASGDKQVIK